MQFITSRHVPHQTTICPFLVNLHLTTPFRFRLVLWLPLEPGPNKSRYGLVRFYKFPLETFDLATHELKDDLLPASRTVKDGVEAGGTSKLHRWVDYKSKVLE